MLVSRRFTSLTSTFTSITVSMEAAYEVKTKGHEGAKGTSGTEAQGAQGRKGHRGARGTPHGPQAFLALPFLGWGVGDASALAPSERCRPSHTPPSSSAHDRFSSGSSGSPSPRSVDDSLK